MKKKKEYDGYGGYVASGLKLGFLVLVMVLIWVMWSGCATNKYGCPSENQRVLDKANKRVFNK